MRAPAKLDVLFEAAPGRGTIARVRTQEPPWRVVRGFATGSGETLVHLHNVSGGILDTDCLQCRIGVGPGAQAQVTTTGATRVYRSRAAGHVARQHVTLHVAENGYLEYLPDPLIPFSGSRFEQTTRIELSRGAALVWWDTIAPGREASGELFRYQSLSSRVELLADAEPLAIEQWTLVPGTENVANPARLGRFRYFSSSYIACAGKPSQYWRSLECELQDLLDRSATADVLWGVTTLRAHGVAVKGAALSGRALWDGMLAMWRAAKFSLCGRVATLPRKIH